MLEELFRKAVDLGRKLAEMERVRFTELLERARSVWREYAPAPPARDLNVMAVDSSWNIRLYEGFYVYALRAAAVDEAQEAHHPVIEFDLISRDSKGLTPENRVKLVAENAEHYVAEQASQEADLVLVDGSLIARLESAENMLRDKPAYPEYLSLARSLWGRDNVVFISKYSQDSSLLSGELGDIYYLKLATSEQGYALVPSHERCKRDDIPITTAYVRLVEHSSPLKVEIPATVGEDLIRWIIDALAPRSVKGYPYALYLAHRAVLISDRLMEMLCKAAGLVGLSSPREVLEI
ncbi:MAG: DNA double-strand break repair nuclease NurA [Nitrososphaerota archaeon]